MFSGTVDKCSVCKKTVYPLEKVCYITYTIVSNVILLPIFDVEHFYFRQRKMANYKYTSIYITVNLRPSHIVLFIKKNIAINY